jgi:hypothetical protein
MFDYNMIVLGRLEHAEAVDGCRKLSVLPSDKPSFILRLLAALRLTHARKHTPWRHVPHAPRAAGL